MAVADCVDVVQIHDHHPCFETIVKVSQIGPQGNGCCGGPFIICVFTTALVLNALQACVAKLEQEGMRLTSATAIGDLMVRLKDHQQLLQDLEDQGKQLQRRLREVVHEVRRAGLGGPQQQQSKVDEEIRNSNLSLHAPLGQKQPDPLNECKCLLVAAIGTFSPHLSSALQPIHTLKPAGSLWHLKLSTADDKQAFQVQQRLPAAADLS